MIDLVAISRVQGKNIRYRASNGQADDALVSDWTSLPFHRTSRPNIPATECRSLCQRLRDPAGRGVQGLRAYSTYIALTFRVSLSHHRRTSSYADSWMLRTPCSTPMHPIYLLPTSKVCTCGPHKPPPILLVVMSRDSSLGVRLMKLLNTTSTRIVEWLNPAYAANMIHMRCLGPTWSPCRKGPFTMDLDRDRRLIACPEVPSPPYIAPCPTFPA